MSSFANSKQIAVVRAAYERAADLLPPEKVLAGRAFLRTNIAVLAGDFVGASNHLDEWNQATVSSTDEAAHVSAFLERSWLLRELGRTAEIVALSESALSTRSAWIPALVNRLPAISAH